MNKELTGIVRYTVEQLVNGLRNRAKMLLDGGNPVTPVDLKCWASWIERAHEDDIAGLRAKLDKAEAEHDDLRDMNATQRDSIEYYQNALTQAQERADLADAKIAELKTRLTTTAEQLAISPGPPSLEPRPSSEYVRLLEEAVHNLPGWWASDWIRDTLPEPCYQRWTKHGPRYCDHYDPPIGCLMALAEALEVE